MVASPLGGELRHQAAEFDAVERHVAVVDRLEDAPWLSGTLKGMGAKHVTCGVTEDMDPTVGSALLTTLAQVAGSDWSEELEQAWADAYGAIGALMLEGASESAAAAATA